MLLKTAQLRAAVAVPTGVSSTLEAVSRISVATVDNGWS